MQSRIQIEKIGKTVTKVILKRYLSRDKKNHLQNIDSMKQSHQYKGHNTNYNKSKKISNPSRLNSNPPTTSSQLIRDYSPSKVCFRQLNCHLKATIKNIQLNQKYKTRSPKLNPFPILINKIIMKALISLCTSQMMCLSRLLSSTSISSLIVVLRNRGSIKFDSMKKRIQIQC